MRPVAWARSRDDLPEVAVLLTGCRDVAAVARGYRTVLPRARIWLYGEDMTAGERASAEAAGAEVRSVPAASRDALVRHMLAEVDADIYILAHRARADDVCVAPLIVAEIDGGKDLVDVRGFADAPAGSTAGKFLSRTVDFAFGGGGDILRSDFKACSRRFALSYRRTPPGAGDASARDLALHALRLRLPIGRVATLGTELPDTGRAPSAWPAVVVIAARLLVAERPRRVLGLIGLALMGFGIAAALPGVKVHHWRASLVPGPGTLLAMGLIAAGAAAGAAGLLLDTLASAGQEVKRLGVAAIPRRADRSHPADR